MSTIILGTHEGKNVKAEGILDILDGPQRKILSALLQHGKEEISKDDLAAASGYGVEGGAFGIQSARSAQKGFSIIHARVW